MESSAFVEFVETPLHEALDGIVADWHVSIDRRLIPDDAQRASFPSNVTIRWASRWKESCSRSV